MNPILISLFSSLLGESVARLLHTNQLIARFERFSDSECAVSIENPEQFKDRDVHIFQSAIMPVNDTMLGVAFLAQLLKQAGAKKVTLVCPYMGYSRQDKCLLSPLVRPELVKGPIEIIAKLLESAGIDELITVELHNPEVKKCFSIPVHELSLDDAIAQHIKRHYGTRKDLCLVAPDKGAYDRVAKIALMVGAKVLVFSKERYAANKTRVVGVSGSCNSRTVIMIDDIIDTAGTAINVATALNEIMDSISSSQPKEIIGYFVHPVLSGDANNRIQVSPFTQIFVSNTLPLVGENPKVEVYDISGMLAEFISARLS